MTKLKIVEGDRIYHRAMYISEIRQTKGSDYMDDPKNRTEIERGFEQYYAQQIRIRELKEQILSPLKELLPEAQYHIVETIVKKTDIEIRELEKLVLPEDDIDTLWETLKRRSSEIQSNPSLDGR